MDTTPPKNSGCAWLFVFGLLAICVEIPLLTFSTLSFLFATAISLLLALLLTQKIMGKTPRSRMFRNILVVFVLVLGARFVLVGLLHLVKSTIMDDTTFKIEEGVGTTFIVENGDTLSVYSSHRKWRDNYGNPYQGNLTVRERDFLQLYNYIDRYKPGNNPNFWGGLYDHIARTDGPKLDLVIRLFEDLQQRGKLNQMEFADMLISCVQDIPYSFVFQGECLPPDNYEDAIRLLLEECPECCIGNKTFGIQNPVSFLQNLKGDCDTRTVLIYTLLKHFGYDVAILNSDFYRHSVIGINLPGNGLFKTYRGKRYLVWETTAKYYPVGELPVNFGDITHWDVILTSK